ncbi:MAG TPA: helix-turn-helix transcriptional regulator [Polyangiales bacterium]
MRRAARELGLSVRSLRRRLAEEGVCYRELAQNILEERSRQLLRDPEVSVQQAAHELGFADASAFHRAFKRWIGVTPSEFREARPEAAAG